MTRGPDPRDSVALNDIAGRYQAGDIAGAEAAALALVAGVREADRKLPGIVWLGFIAQQRGDLQAARDRFIEARRIDRRNPNLLVQLGALHDRLNELEPAESCYRDAIRLEPRMAVAHYNLGVVLMTKRDFAGARRAYEAAVLHEPSFFQAFLNLGNVFLQLNEPASAKECYRRAIALNPGFGVAHHALGLLAMRHQQLDAALQCFQAAVDAEPGQIEAWVDLAECHHRSGNLAAARNAIDAALSRQPAHPVAQFKRAQYAGEQPAAMPDAMVVKLFEAMAPSFDSHLVERLDYTLPRRLAEFLSPWISSGQERSGRGLTVLDLGCGTGLFGPEIADAKSRLVGVDLSPGMIERAAARGLYDALHAQSIGDYLAEGGETFDLIVAADVLIYVGALESLFAGARARLNAGGRFAFSVESPRDLQDGYRLLEAGRFAHAPGYVESVAASQAFKLVSREPAVIRQENGQAIDGFIYLLAPA